MAAEATVEAIREAVEEGNAEAVARMLDEDPQLLTTTMWGLFPLLTRAAFNGHLGIVKLLLERGADVNTSTAITGTALHYAAKNGHEEVVSTLLSSGADVYSRNARGGWTALLCASHRGHVAVVRLLLRSMRGRGLNERTMGYTTLNVACIHGHADIVRALLLAGADHAIAYIVDGTTPQQAAQNNHHPECAALIQVSTV
jgi:ankyrin repeat protein